MNRWWNDLDRILRGEATRASEPNEIGFPMPLGGLLLGMTLLTAFYGVCMGFFSGFRDGGPYYMQWLAGIVKMPCLFALTVAVTFPSLYVFNALAGSRLRGAMVFRLLVISLAVNVAVLASLGPIVAFFSVSTTSYPFILLLNVVAFLVSGVLGFSFMLQTLYRWMPPPHTSLQRDVPEPSQPAEDGISPLSAEKRAASARDCLAGEQNSLWGIESIAVDRRVRRVFIGWMVAFGLVLAQMSWVLRPFLGDPVAPFHWFCPRESNFFQALLDALRNLFA